MASNISMDEIVNCTLKGIINARKDYLVWSDWEGLYQAPEYLQTVYIAREIAKIKKNKFLTLEDNINYIVTEANTMKNDEIDLSEDVRPNGRADIVLWWASGHARAIIEVKKWVYNINHIKKDLKRIHKMLIYKYEDNRLQFGISTFYISQYFKRGDALNTLEKHMKNKIFKAVKKYGKEHGLKIEPYYELFEEDDNFAWGAVSLIVTVK